RCSEQCAGTGWRSCPQPAGRRDRRRHAQGGPNGMVSYMGSYRFLPREVLDFHITAQPEGRQQALTLKFRDRLGRR
ncbi:MAG TPA: hypothetical protein VEZ89_00995, partial [Rubrivivax sp.]|nr:hypothetical protein [Rubrivivax sp.]